MQTILIIEDDAAIREELKILLNGAGYEALFVTDFEHPVDRVFETDADLLLLDITLPNLNGEEILRQLRKPASPKRDLPVIMVTSRTSDADEVLSMSYGADDYITKPYNPTILLLRIAAVLKRRGGTADEPVFYRGQPVDFARGTVGGVSLTKNEMLIFQMLLKKQGKIVSRDELMTALWDDGEFVGDNTLSVNVSRLRAKLAGLFADEQDIIETKKKQGYILL